MRLAALLSAIEESKGPVTGIELALRLGVSPGEVAAMLDALRASGQLGPEPRPQQPTDTCSSAGSCSLSCPGPEECSLVIDLSVAGLEIRSSLAG
ncbi:MAG: FeoC-like transcriptional regulator [Acidimicrobiia bacterium]|nr:FeoC-like transcriptional regulator [Acidimicrobiia bacterium]